MDGYGIVCVNNKFRQRMIVVIADDMSTASFIEEYMKGEKVSIDKIDRIARDVHVIDFDWRKEGNESIFIPKIVPDYSSYACQKCMKNYEDRSCYDCKNKRTKKVFAEIQIINPLNPVTYY